MRQIIKSVVVIMLVTGFLALDNSTFSSGIGTHEIRSIFVCTPIPVQLGEAINGILASGDCVDTNTAFYDGYTFTATTGERINIALTSEAFAPSLRLVQGSYPGGTVLATGADAGNGTRRITAFTIPTAGNYTIVASSTAAAGRGGYTVSLEPTIPRVDLIQRTSPNPATPGSIVGYSVFFTSAVTGVDISDFVITANGISGAVITSVSGSGSIYSVAINTGSGNGNLQLDLIDNDTIINGLGMPLGGVGVGNGNFTTGPSYTIAASTPTPSPTAPPNTVVVTNTEDSGSGSLRQAINDVASGGTIQFSALFGSPQTITLSSGELRVTRPVTINGPGQNLLTVSGNNTSRVFNLGGSSPVIAIMITGVTITAGRAPDNDFGGGIESNFVNLSLSNSTVSGNNAPGTGTLGNGGGVDSFEGSVAITNCTITANQANNDGGGILSDSGPLTITNSVITLNQTLSAQGSGGAVRSGGGGATTITDTIIQSNQVSPVSGFGGGLFITGGGNLNLASSTLRLNSAANGGGLFFTGAVTASISNSTIEGNTAADQGGGLYAQNANATLINTTISGNAANGANIAGGAAILDAISGNRTTQFTNCTITANTAVQNAGGGVISLGRTAVTANASVSFRNTIIANNSGPNIRAVSENGAISTVVSQGFNLTNDNASGFLNQTTDKLNAEPGLAPLADNGGPSRTHSLVASSAAIDAGNSSGSINDQRGAGFLRVIDLSFPNGPGSDGSDIGAFELQSEPAPAFATVSGTVLTPSGLALRNAVVIMTDSQGVRRTATTSSFGVFSFAGVANGQTYTFSVSSKRYRFAPQTRTVNGNVSNLSFVGLE